MSTVRDLITDALILLGVASAEETLSAADLQLGMRSLNRMIESWATERLILFHPVREVFELAAGKADYTMGTGGDFDTVRPMDIMGAAYGVLEKTPIYETPEPDPEADPEDPPPEPVLVGYDLKVKSEYPMNVYSTQQWVGQHSKALQSSGPSGIYAHGSSPVEKLSIWPVPTSTQGLVLYSKKTLSNFEDASDEVSLPVGYEEAIVYNLAFRLAPSFGRQMPAEAMDIAKVSKANIKRQNTQVSTMRTDAPTSRKWNGWTGGYW